MSKPQSKNNDKRMRSKLLLLLMTVAYVAVAQNATLAKLFTGTLWTDGNAVYRAERRNMFVNMEGGTLHEGGFAFGLLCTDPKNLDFVVQTPNSDISGDDGGFISLPCQAGASVETRTLGNETYLVVNNENDDAVYSLRLMKDGEELEKIIVDQWLHVWEGKYSVSYSAVGQCPKGSVCTIAGGRFALGSYYNGRVKVMDEYETPTNIVKLDNGKFIRIQPSGKPSDLRYGINLYAASYDSNNDLYTDGQLLMVLKRIPSATSHWPETASRVLLPGEIYLHPLTELRVMRNEIFARHGYRFSSNDLKGYFKAEPWYKMDSDPDVNKKIHFSAIESINIQLLQNTGNSEYYDGPALFSDSEVTDDSNADDDPIYHISPWEKRSMMIAHFEYNEVEISSETVTPYNLNAPGNVTFEWCKAEGSDFKVGLSHRKLPGNRGELKHVVIRKNGSSLAYPMIKIGEESPLPETTIRVNGRYLWIELKDITHANYFFYNLDTHVLSRSNRSAYLNRTAPADAKKTWREIIGAQLSPKAY